MTIAQLALLVPVVNLLVILLGGLYSLSILKNALSTGLDTLRLMHSDIVNHTERLSRLETRAKDQAEEIERVRERLDKALDIRTGKARD